MKVLFLGILLNLCIVISAIAADMPDNVIVYDYNTYVVPAPVIVEQVPVQPIELVPVTPYPVCWYEPDPYTFLGDIFGYDYIYVCR